MVHAAASIAIRDGWCRGGGRTLEGPKELAAIRGATVVLMGVSYGVAMAYQGSLVGLLLATYGAVVQFFPALVATLYWRRATGPGVLAAIVGGSVVTAAFVLMPDWRPVDLHAGLYGLTVNVGLLWAVSKWTPQGDCDAWLACAAGEGTSLPEDQGLSIQR